MAKKINYASTLLKQNASRDQQKQDMIRIRMWTRLNAYTEYINIILGALYGVAQLQGNEYMRITREKLACIL